MKKIFLLMAAAVLALPAAKVKAQEGAQPVTVVTVTVTEEREVVKAGPYARFAQKYLGAVVPLTDKESFSIKGAAISGSTAGGHEAARLAEAPPALTRIPNLASDTSFVRVAPDRVLSTGSLEEHAAAAAQRLFTLRNRRFDVITSEAGENVFGAGLGAAIEEMKRLEEEYISLFAGKSFRETRSVTYKVVPQKGAQNIVVCRFSESAGLLYSNDLTGRPIVLELSGETVPQTAETAEKGSKNVESTQIYLPATVSYRLKDGNTVIAEELLSVYQLGVTAEVPAQKK